MYDLDIVLVEVGEGFDEWGEQFFFSEEEEGGIGDPFEEEAKSRDDFLRGVITAHAIDGDDV